MLLSLGLVLFLSTQNGLSQKPGDSCRLKHSPGECTKPSKCTSGIEDFQKHGIFPTYCEPSGDLMCCRKKMSLQNRVPAVNSNNKYVWGNYNSNENENKNQRVSERKCAEYSSAVVQTVGFIALTLDPEPQSISAPKCDYNGVELIVGGEDANQGEFPHMTAVGWTNDDDSIVFQCGGSLISNRFVLTAGHCILNPRMKNSVPRIVRLGDQNLDPKVRDGANPIDITIKKVHKHSDYKPPLKYNDIALFELQEEVNFNSDIRPACLWTKPDFSVHTKAIATGWGVNNSRSRETVMELQKVSLSLLENDKCDNLLEGIRHRNWNGFVPSQMCAGELRGGKDTCQGDSGSPLQVVSRDNKCIFYVVGITSFGHYCAQSGTPSVFTRVSSYLDWVESVVWPGE